MPNSPLDASDMPTVLPGQVSPGQPAMRSPLSQEAHKALEVLRYNLPFVPIMPLVAPVKFYYIPLSEQNIPFNINFPDGALAVWFDCGSPGSVFFSTKLNPPSYQDLSNANVFYQDEFTELLPIRQWLYCENVKQVTALCTSGGETISARFYVQL